ncbi:MAG: prepilin-type N-terminal cleavage/methylation domain-containing protein [Desulfobulbaceae bacterium]|jgi:type IV pilus assembly protein PilW|nr:prepilin-type N-terminal cleavage/methylation domain-containing protein [Desulfobulbaceae bacterium]
MDTTISGHFREQGFTLVELLMAMAISGLIVAALLAFFWAQENTANTQQGVALMQGDLVAAAQTLAQDIRMARYNPRGEAQLPHANCAGNFTPDFQTGVAFNNSACSLPTSVSTDATNLAFVSDHDGNGKISATDTPLEQVAYRFQRASGANLGRLQRYNPSSGISTWPDVIENIDGLEFLYELDGGVFTCKPAAAQLPSIQAVWVTILARAELATRGYSNTDNYAQERASVGRIAVSDSSCNLTAGNFNGGKPYNDSFRRQLLTFAVRCRN